jgi:UDP-N-acetylglucosamine 2-epimerase (non-hydrolysing)/UDP-GlcNAc3NAcA epimerase
MPSEFYYLTCHREENTHDTAALGEILEAMNSLDAPVIYPVHPRNVASVKRMLRYKPYRNIMFVQPLGYLESLYLVNNAKQVVTDSGGLQREAFFAEVKCTTIFNYVTCPETMINNRNILAKPDSKSILAAMNTPQQAVGSCKPFGDGHSAIKIVDALVNHNEVL